MLFNATHGVELDPKNMTGKLLKEKVTSKQSYERILQSFGFGMFQERAVGQPSPVQEERVKTKRITSRRHALGYVIGIKDLEKDPNKLVASKAPKLRAAYIHTLNALIQLAFIKGGASSGFLSSMVDDLAIYSTAHLLKDGTTQSNKASYPISAPHLLQMLADLNSQRGWEGMPVTNCEQWDILADPGKQPFVQTILESDLFAGTSNNDESGVIQRSFRSVIAMKYWALGGTTTTNTLICNPVSEEDRPFFMMETEALTMEDDKLPSVGLQGFYAWFETVIESLTHHNTLMTNT